MYETQKYKVKNKIEYQNKRPTYCLCIWKSSAQLHYLLYASTPMCAVTSHSVTEQAEAMDVYLKAAIHRNL
jgi:hypothetical protein